MLALAGQQPYHTTSGVEAETMRRSNILYRPTSSLSPGVLHVACECIALTAHGHGPISYGVAEARVEAG